MRLQRSPLQSLASVVALALSLTGCVELYGAACDTRVTYPPVQAESTTGLLRFLVDGSCLCSSKLDGGDVVIQVSCGNSSSPGGSTANLNLFLTSPGDQPHVDIATVDEIAIFSEVDDPCTRVIGTFGTFRYGPFEPAPEGWERFERMRPVHIEHLLIPAQDALSPLICPDAPPIPIEESEAFGVDVWCVP